MTLEAWIFLLALILSAILLFSMILFIILSSDLECDYVNPIDLCMNLNRFVVPEYIIHAVLSFSLLVPFSLSMFCWNLPLLFYHWHKMYRRTMFYDATEIFRLLGKHKKEAFAKLAFYLASFFLYLYKMIVAIVG